MNYLPTVDNQSVALSEMCCIRGNLYSLRYSQICTETDYILTPPSWEDIKILDLKAGVGLFLNADLVRDVKQFLSSAQEHKIFHIEFSTDSVNLHHIEPYPIFYKTQEWNHLIKLLNTYEIIGNVRLDVFVRFTTGQGIKLNKLQSSSFAYECWLHVEKKIKMARFDGVAYHHSLESYKGTTELKTIPDWHTTVPAQYVISRDKWI